MRNASYASLIYFRTNKSNYFLFPNIRLIQSHKNIFQNSVMELRQTQTDVYDYYTAAHHKFSSLELSINVVNKDCNKVRVSRVSHCLIFDN